MLRCLWKSGADIRLVPNATVSIGRDRQTTITSLKCPRRHFDISYDPDSRTATVSPSTANARRRAFAVNDNILYDRCSLKPGDVLHVLPGQFGYRFEVPDEPEAVISVQSKWESGTITVESDSVESKLKGTTSRTVSVAVTKPKSGWITASNELLIYLDGSSVGSEKIAGFDLDGTLIVTKSGRVFPKDVDDWRIAFASVPGKLKQLRLEGYRIVVFTNQKGISLGHCSHEDFKKKIEAIFEKLGAISDCFVSPGNGLYRKPLTGMWEEFEKNYNDGVRVDRSRSIYVGDAAGRDGSSKSDKRKDHSSADRLFAMNLGVRFSTPEEFFLDSPPQSFHLPTFSSRSLIDQRSSISLLDPPSSKLCSSNLELVVLVGFPASGKSHFYDAHLKPRRFAHVSRDELGSWQKCVEATEKHLRSGQSVAVDNTNPDSESRKRYVDAAKRVGVRCRCFVMNCSYEQALHNNKFRTLLGADQKHRDVNVMVISSYRSKFQEPTKNEGFDEIARVNFVPKFADESQGKLYSMYLVEK